MSNGLFLIEAVIQEFEGWPYVKFAYLHSNNSVDYHNQLLQGVNYRVASVKSRPALDADLVELKYDLQGNTDCIDGEPVEQVEHIDGDPTNNAVDNLRIVSDESSNSDTGQES